MKNTPEKPLATGASHIQQQQPSTVQQAHPLLAALIGGTALGIILVAVTALFQHMGWFH